MIRMYCDHCGAEVPQTVNGGVRVRTGNRELALQLCGKDQAKLREYITEFCVKNTPREVSPSLKKEDRR